MVLRYVARVGAIVSDVQYCRNVSLGCGRVLREIEKGHMHCGDEPTHHAIFTTDGIESTLLCREHAIEANKTTLPPVQIHPRCPDCCMPGAKWIREERICKVPDEHNPLLVVDELVGARAAQDSEVMPHGAALMEGLRSGLEACA